jgi:hypothetical protein
MLFVVNSVRRQNLFGVDRNVDTKFDLIISFDGSGT